MNRVDVIIPVKNRSALLTTRALASLQVQDHADFEVTIVDDGSNQEELAKIEAVVIQMQQEGFHVRLMPNRRKPGASGARNTGFLSTSNPFVIWLDSDDEFLPNKLASDLALIQREECDFSISRAQHVVENNPIQQFWGMPWAPAEDKYRFHLPFQTMCAIFRRSFLEAHDLLWNEELIAHNDWEFSNRCLLLSNRWNFSQVVTSYYHVPQKTGDSIGSKLTLEKITSQRRAMALVRQLMVEKGLRYTLWDELRVLRHKWFLRSQSRQLQRAEDSSI